MNAPTHAATGSPVFVAAVGDARDPGTWSGIPYHLSEAGKRTGFITDGLPLDTNGALLKARRLAWNLLRVATGDRRGGYQYSEEFLEFLWRPVRERIRGGTVLNCFQLFPPSVVADRDVGKWCFIDLSLTQVFDYYRLRDSVGHRIAADAIAREYDVYQKVKGVIAMSRFTADHLHAVYGVPQNKVHVVVPGANLDEAIYRRWEEGEGVRRNARTRDASVLKLVMVTTDWRRKGLDRLLRALAQGRRGGLRMSLRVVGATREEVPADLAGVSGVEWLGRIGKRTNPGAFLSAVSDADVGCILPTYEAGGSVLREYHALGLAALATTAGGMPDFMFEDATIRVSPDAGDDEILAKLFEMERNRDAVEALRSAAWKRRHQALWQESVRQLQDLVT